MHLCFEKTRPSYNSTNRRGGKCGEAELGSKFCCSSGVSLSWRMAAVIAQVQELEHAKEDWLQYIEKLG